MANKKLTVHSNGVDGVVVTEDGERIDGVRSVTVRIEPRDLTRVDIEVVGIPVNITDAVVDEVTMTCPVCEHSTTHRCNKEL